MKTHLLLIWAVIVCSAATRAQLNDKTTYNADTLSTAELTEIGTAYRQTSMSYFFMIDSLSNAGDSIGASQYFLKLNPYQLFAEHLAPDSVDHFISKYQYKITPAARREFINRYTAAYYAPKSAAYYRFKQMEDEDQEVRRSFVNAKEPSFAKLMTEVAQPTDSLHFDYLFRYVKKNGWPSLEDGSLPASLIAIHDHARHSFYLPLLKKAVMKGQADANAYALMYYWNAHSHDGVLDVQQYIARGKYLRFDVSELINRQPVPQATFNNIKYAIKKHCPVKTIYVGETHDKKIFDKWIAYMISVTSYKTDVLRLLVREMAEYNCKISPIEMLNWKSGNGATVWQPSEQNELKLYFYVLYDRDDSTPKFNKLLTDNKWITHAIRFETGKSVIEQESRDFVGQFAEWLTANPTIKLEIDGHTDSSGIAVANQKLSEDRAQAVKDMLVAAGVAAERLTSKGFGASRPLRSNNTIEGRAENRRVEFVKQ